MFAAISSYITFYFLAHLGNCVCCDKFLHHILVHLSNCVCCGKFLYHILFLITKHKLWSSAIPGYCFCCFFFLSQIMQDQFGETKPVELCPGGASKDVDNGNK